MSDLNISFDSAILTNTISQWGGTCTKSVVDELENGKVIFLPQLAFELTEQEKTLLTTELVDPKRKNISYQPLKDKLNGVAVTEKEAIVRDLLQRHYKSSLQLIDTLLPEYQKVLHAPTNSLRLHPVNRWTQKTSWRKDDSRLHVDAFPSRPNYGERILRIFTNINPAGESRNWRIGEDFSTLVKRFLPNLKSYSPLNSWLQNAVGITKSYRSHYDHLMLQMHDAMKADDNYQRLGPQLAINFPPGSSWICFSDQTPHAAMGGQFMLEQTFLLPVNLMKNPQYSPLKVLEGIIGKSLI